MRKIIPYNPKLKEIARKLRNNSKKSEIHLWDQLKSKKLKGYSFYRQKPLLNFIADFYCHELNLVIELDGYTHLFEETVKKDKIKQQELEKIGMVVIRFRDKDVTQNLEGVIMEIEKFIVNHKATHP